MAEEGVPVLSVDLVIGMRAADLSAKSGGEIRRKSIVRDLTEPHWIRIGSAIVFGAAVLARSREGCRRARGSQNADMAKKDKLRTGPRSFLNAGTGAALSVSAIYAVI